MILIPAVCFLLEIKERGICALNFIQLIEIQRVQMPLIYLF